MTVVAAVLSVTSAKAQTSSDSLVVGAIQSADTLVAADTLRTTDHKTLRKKRLSIIKRFFKNFDDYDTTYISPNYYNYTAMLQTTNNFQTYRITGRDEDGNTQSISARPNPNVKIGPYFGWRWIFLGYTFDVTHPKSLGESAQFNFSLYSSMLGCDFIYRKNSGNYNLRRATGFEGVDPKAYTGQSFSGLSSDVLSFSAYYIFNHRHFSYPAAYNQSTVQRKSCGSGILGLGYSQQRVDFDYTTLPAGLITDAETGEEKIIEEMKFSKIHYQYYYVSGGYGYNWVFACNWLLGASVTPTIGIRKAKGEKLKGNEALMDIRNFSFDCISRVGLVWNNTRWFAGASFISHLYMYRKKRLSLTNSVNFLNVYVGFNFCRRKQYR